MPYALLADAVLALHVAVVLFVVGGLVLVVAGNLRGWGWINRLPFRLAHLAAIGYVAAQAWLGVACPLTTLELWLRREAGEPTHGASFIGHWLQRLLYYDAPPSVFVLAYTLFGLLVAAAWWRWPPRGRASKPPLLVPTRLQDLALDPATHPRGQPHLSAASGLARVGGWLYAVADDEHHLARLPADGGDVRLHRLRAGDLPADKAERKRLKPDLEALVFLPALPGHAHGALLALGSGSKPPREQALLLALDSDGLPHGEARAIDLAGLYQPLRAGYPDLNIEGAFVLGPRLCLLQRGNKGDARNACIGYPLDELQAWLLGQRGEPPAAHITAFALGEVGGVPLGFTDGAALPGGGWLFSAVAEDTSDSYNDGGCAGSAIGWVDADGRLRRMQPIAGSPKVEGIALAADGHLLMVTDADDPAIASQLLALRFP